MAMDMNMWRNICRFEGMGFLNTAYVAQTALKQAGYDVQVTAPRTVATTPAPAPGTVTVLGQTGTFSRTGEWVPAAQQASAQQQPMTVASLPSPGYDPSTGLWAPPQTPQDAAVLAAAAAGQTVSNAPPPTGQDVVVQEQAQQPAALDAAAQQAYTNEAARQDLIAQAAQGQMPPTPDTGPPVYAGGGSGSPSYAGQLQRGVATVTGRQAPAAGDTTGNLIFWGGVLIPIFWSMRK